jgi:hypothetical protein
MLPINAGRPASAAAGREPRAIDRTGSAIDFSPSTPPDPIATARPWRPERRSAVSPMRKNGRGAS